MFVVHSKKLNLSSTFTDYPLYDSNFKLFGDHQRKSKRMAKIEKSKSKSESESESEQSNSSIFNLAKIFTSSLWKNSLSCSF